MAADQLSQREREVSELAARGLSNDEIAARLDISRRTVETHLRTVFHKTGVSRRSQLVALARDGGLLAPEPTGPAGTAGMTGPDITATQPPAAARRLELYASAVRRLIDRQFPLFEESVELTMVIGDRDGQDIVLERRRTVPRPYVVYRALRPIVASTGGGPTDPDELGLTYDVHGKDIHADVSLVQDTDGQPLALVLFQPGLAEATEWTLRYHSPGLWNPLRESGTDTLVWATATLDGRHQPPVTGLALTVIFPAGWSDLDVVERDGLGTRHVERLPSGQTQVTWRDGTPVAGTYHWQLHGRSPG